MNDTFSYIDEKNKKGGKKFYKESCSDFYTYIQVRELKVLRYTKVLIFSLIYKETYRLKKQNLYLIVKIWPLI